MTKESSDLFRLDGKVAIITGSSRGIGRAIATEMARAGAKVVISSRKLDACEATRDALVSEGLSAIAVACHAGRKEDLERLVAETIKAYGRVDICVSNVGVNPAMGSLSEISETVWDKIFETNLKGTWWLAKAVLPEIAKHGGGSFTIIASIAALRVVPIHPAYNVSKLALLGLTQNLAQEWGVKGVRVNAIAPGLIQTELSASTESGADSTKDFIERLPLRRIGLPVDIGGVGVFLASRAASYVTGQTLVVDGGFML